MKYLPFEKICYSTKVDSVEILKRIEEIIEPKKTFSLTGVFGRGNLKDYEGFVKKNEFKINRIIGYRNSFLPQIKGLVEKDFTGTKVHLKMHLHPFVMLFMCVWFGGVGLGFLAFLPSLLNLEDFEPLALLPFGMLIFGYLLVTLSFKFESKKTRKYFLELFDAKIDD